MGITPEYGRLSEVRTVTRTTDHYQATTAFLTVLGQTPFCAFILCTGLTHGPPGMGGSGPGGVSRSGNRDPGVDRGA